MKYNISKLSRLATAEFIGNIFASQAGHHSRINRQVYAVEAAGPLTGLLWQHRIVDWITRAEYRKGERLLVVAILWIEMAIAGSNGKIDWIK